MYSNKTIKRKFISLRESGSIIVPDHLQHKVRRRSPPTPPNGASEIPATSTSSGQCTVRAAITGIISTIFGSNDEGCCGGEDGDKDEDEEEDEDNVDEEEEEDDDKPTLPPLPRPTLEDQHLAPIEKTFVLVAVGFKRAGKQVNWKGVTADIELWKRKTLTVLDALSQPGLVQREPKVFGWTEIGGGRNIYEKK